MDNCHWDIILYPVMSLQKIAVETIEILKKGEYTSPEGEIISIRKQQQFSEQNSILYTPQQATQLLQQKNDIPYGPSPIIQITSDKSQQATQRLVEMENISNPVVLNFASAKHPGGGFVSGARAQEEDLARCSGLYHCLLPQTEYYRANRNYKSLLYTDHIIYSPSVVWFRDRENHLLNKPYLASVITAPAPNAARLSKEERTNQLEQTIRRRVAMILAIARQHNHRTLVLGAWGCGVFANDPYMIAEAFSSWLDSSSFRGHFERVEFAIYDSHPSQKTIQAFRNVFNEPESEPVND